MSVLYPDLDFTTFPNALDNISLKVILQILQMHN